MENKKIYLDIYGETAYKFCKKAFSGCARLKPEEFELLPDNSVVFNLPFSDSDPVEIRKKIVRRLKFYARQEFNYGFETSIEKIRRECYRNADQANCLAGLVEGLSKKELTETFGKDMVSMFDDTNKRDPLRAEAIRIIEEQIWNIRKEYEKKLAEFTRAAKEERDSLIYELDKQLAQLKEIKNDK